MQRVHWTPDLLEAHIVANLLRAHDLHAWAFDTAFVRQDWFKVLAFGGFRVMVPYAQVGEAAAIVRAWRNGDLALADDDIACPRCHENRSIENTFPRRAVFMLLIAFGCLPWLFVAAADLPGEAYVEAGVFVLSLALFVPGVVGGIVKSRYACEACSETWRAEPERFDALDRAVRDAAQS